VARTHVARCTTVCVAWGRETDVNLMRTNRGISGVLEIRLRVTHRNPSPETPRV